MLDICTSGGGEEDASIFAGGSGVGKTENCVSGQTEVVIVDGGCASLSHLVDAEVWTREADSGVSAVDADDRAGAALPWAEARFRQKGWATRECRRRAFRVQNLFTQEGQENGLFSVVGVACLGIVGGERPGGSWKFDAHVVSSGVFDGEGVGL